MILVATFMGLFDVFVVNVAAPDHAARHPRLLVGAPARDRRVRVRLRRAPDHRRPARRPLQLPAPLHRRHGGVHARPRPAAGSRDADRADRRAGRAGARRRADGAAGARADHRALPAGRAPPRARLVRRHGRARRDRRSGARGRARPDRPLRLGLAHDLLRQRPDRGGDGRARGTAAARTTAPRRGRSSIPVGVLGVTGALGARARPAHARPQPGLALVADRARSARAPRRRSRSRSRYEARARAPRRPAGARPLALRRALVQRRARRQHRRLRLLRQHPARPDPLPPARASGSRRSTPGSASRRSASASPRPRCSHGR